MIDKIKLIMATVFDVESSSIAQETSSETIEKWDSINHMNLITSLEDEFDIRFDDAEIAEMLNFKAIFESVTKKINK
ncbi:MAG: acyl carrier protein [Bacteroidetes bacterium]|nr:acyl carrier protein [Bacteroidota bacterium]